MRRIPWVSRNVLKILLWAGTTTVLVGALGLTGRGVPQVLADSPAITDFGLDESDVPVLAVAGQRPDAVFLTLYGDGRRHLEVKSIDGDAVVGFVGQHSAWRRDDALSWFVQMPVYVRVILRTPLQDGVMTL